MKSLLSAALCLLLLKGVVAPPVTANKKEDSSHENEVDGNNKGPDWDVGLEYNRYLQEVVQALESDPQFRDKLEKAEVADIRTGKIASELEFVNHNVRSKLDELKRQELERLRHLAIKQYELSQQEAAYGIEPEADNPDHDPKRLKLPIHVDHKNPHSFEIEDLRKLIVQTTKDLEEADRKRRQDFKEYEMQKEFEKNQQLNLLDEDHKKEMEHTLETQEKKHKDHPTLHHPGSKPQLEQVWEEQDHMNPEDFNPKTFFHLHDLDGNGVWDADEVKTLFQKELDKMYDPNAPEDDMRERREEMERMREHVFNETDVNRDQLISYQEFLDQTKRQEFEQDQGWDGLDNQKVYTHDEYEQFEKRRQQEVQHMIDQGLLPPQPEMHLPYGMQAPPEYVQQQQQQQFYQQQQQHHNQQLPPHAQQQVHHQQQAGFHPAQGQAVHPDQMGQYQYHGDPSQQFQGGHPNQQYQAGHHPPQGQAYHPPAPNVQQHHPNAALNQHLNQPPVYQNQQGHHNQPPVHHNQPPVHQNQPPVYQNQQGHHNQPPVHHNQPPVHQNQPPVYQNQQHHNQPPVQQHNPPPVHQNPPPVYQKQPPVHHNQPPQQGNAIPQQQQHQVPVNEHAVPANQVHAQGTANQVPASASHDNVAPAHVETQGTVKQVHEQQQESVQHVDNEIPHHDVPKLQSNNV